MQRHPHRVALFTKTPESPAIKRRLSAQIGPQKARDCYLELLDNAILCASHFGAMVYVAGPVNSSAWLRGLSTKFQIEGDLGERMFACFQDGISVLFGGDSPLLTVEYIHQAIDALVSNDLVLGPTEDGGYLLIGMNTPHAELFQQIPWSTPEVATKTLTIADELNLQVECLETVWDVDSERDYERWLTMK